MGKTRRLARELVRGWHVARYRLAQRASRGGEGAGAAFYERMWREEAQELGAEAVALGDGFFEIRKDGRATRVCGPFVEIDHPLTLELAGHKPLVHELLGAAGLPVPAYARFSLHDRRPALAFLERSQLVVGVGPHREQHGADAGFAPSSSGFSPCPFPPSARAQLF